MQRQQPSLPRLQKDTSVLITSGLNLIQQGISIFGEDLCLLVANRRFLSMFGLPKALMEPGARFSDIIKFLAENGEYGPVDDVESFVKSRVEQALAFEPHYLERKRSNGRWLSIEGGPLRQGGWIAVYTDITEIKRQEEMLRSRSDELSVELLDRSEELARTNRALEATINRLHETQQHLEAAEARIRLAAETTPAHIARLDRREIYTYSNQKLPLTAANGASDILGHTARDILGDTVYQEIKPALSSAFAGEPKVVEFGLPDEGRHIRAAFTPDTNSSDTVTGVYVLSMDTTLAQHAGSSRTTEHLARAHFGKWDVNFDLLELRSGENSVELSQSVATLLRIFMRSANKLLPREEIVKLTGRQSSDRALDVRISRLRQKLGDDAKAPKHVRTIYGAGYIFVGKVEWES